MRSGMSCPFDADVDDEDFGQAAMVFVSAQIEQDPLAAAGDPEILSEGREVGRGRRADCFGPGHQRQGVAQHDVLRPRCQKFQPNVEGRAVGHFEPKHACTTADAAGAERHECPDDNFAGELSVECRKQASVELGVVSVM